MKRYLLVAVFAVSCLTTAAQQQAVTFEMRHFTQDAKADGVTDFHGDTEWLNTDQRVAALNSYAGFASKFWGDPDLDTPLFSDAQVRERTAQIKPQPLTSVRQTLRLSEWHSCASSKGKNASLEATRANWSGKGVTISDGCLVIDGGEVSPAIDTMGWRFEMKMVLSQPSRWLQISLKDENGAAIEIDVKDLRNADKLDKIEVYGDFPGRVIFVSSNGVTLKEMSMPESFGRYVAAFTLSSEQGMTQIDDFSLYSFIRTPATPRTPFVTVLHYDDDFDELPCMSGWQTATYDDSKWDIVTLPSALGGLKSEGESYYLRTKVHVGEFKYASLEIETLDPAGEVWVNGEIAAVLKGRQPRSVDVSEYLIPNAENTIAVRVKPYKAENTMLHAPSDLNIGWFLGRTELILTKTTSHIVRNLVHTSSLADDKAVQRHKLTVKNETGFSRKGSVRINYYPWFPEEGECVASISKDIELRPRVENIYDIDMVMEKPQVWTVEAPKLYKVEVIIYDDQGNPVDDFVTTTGIRVIEQKEGVLYINHKPEMLNGAQNFGCRLPIEDIAKTIRCGSDEMIMRDLMMAQKLGNLLRIHIHSEMDVVDGVNDPRFAEYADQMGLYLIWQSAGWLREGEVWNVDIENWPDYIRQVYNHPSIVLWEASNHPNRFKNHDISDTEDYFNRIIPAIVGVDTSRLVSPTSFWQHSHYGVYDGTVDYQGNPIAANPNLMHKMMTRGSQDAYTGYGEKWSTLRNFPYPWAKSCLEAKDLCYFNFEHEESAAQPNWTLARKDPWYNVPSYEWEYEEGSIGRLLQFDEWRASQAFQAFSAWESMKIQTLAGVAGFSWCSLESGPNMFTYQKPLVDPYYVPKLAFHANRMVFGKIWAASDDVDTVYGPGDQICPVVFNLGDACTATLTVELCNEHGKVLERKVLKNVQVEAGRSVTRLEPFRFKSKAAGTRFIVYKLSY